MGTPSSVKASSRTAAAFSSGGDTARGEEFVDCQTAAEAGIAYETDRHVELDCAGVGPRKCPTAARVRRAGAPASVGGRGCRLHALPGRGDRWVRRRVATRAGGRADIIRPRNFCLEPAEFYRYSPNCDSQFDPSNQDLTLCSSGEILSSPIEDVPKAVES